MITIQNMDNNAQIICSVIYSEISYGSWDGFRLFESLNISSNMEPIDARDAAESDR